MSAQTSNAGQDEPAPFHHGRDAGPRTGPMQSLTRYLCAAVYLDNGFCDTVLKEYVYGRHRAIVPSDGYDLEPVIRHARHARLLRLGRDAAICLLWAVFLVLLTWHAVAYLVLAGAAVLLRAVLAQYLNRRLAIAGTLVVGLLLLLGYLTGDPEQADSFGEPAYSLGEEASATGGPGPWDVLWLLLIHLAFTAVSSGHVAVVYRVLARRLAPGAHGPGPAAGGERFARALARVRASQTGNVTLYAGDNPFLGTGHPKSPGSRVWSIVLELDRTGGPEPGLVPRPVDPWVMHERVRARLDEMRDETAATAKPPLPENERIGGLVIRWHIAAPGTCVQRTRPVGPSDQSPYSGHPLIDPASWLPFSSATDAAVEAIVRHPQAGMRAFQRVTVAGPGQAVRGRDGAVLAPAEEQDTVLTVFLHLAVEGRMLYGQFAATVLPPIRPVYKIVDAMPGWRSSTLLPNALRAGSAVAFAASALAVPRLAGVLGQILGDSFSSDFGADPADELVHDYGATLSVREATADAKLADFFQEFDVDKYARLIERRVNEAVLDYLARECGVDVSAYRDQAAMIMNNGVIMHGGSISGQVAVGGRVEQRQQPRINP
ncbi:hypothetical protein [Spirillospora albida]|uniref:hypothetical protein n=1 Tax=Spirillospora albida TaxID=58123 RepID=UPI0004C1A6CA|nr:hypothetical protein [Spirillospora albida]